MIDVNAVCSSMLLAVLPLYPSVVARAKGIGVRG